METVREYFLKLIGYDYDDMAFTTNNEIDTEKFTIWSSKSDDIADDALRAYNKTKNDDECNELCNKKEGGSSIFMEIFAQIRNANPKELPVLEKVHVNKLIRIIKDRLSYTYDGDSLSDNRPILRFFEQCCTYPSWLDWNKIERGQYIFLKYFSSSAIGLLYYSLIGGFSSPKLIDVLDQTSYLTKHEKLTVRRLHETLLMVLDCMDGKNCLTIGSQGWISVLRVRLLHARVRLKLMKKREDNQSVLPINQSDLAATLYAFSINIVDTLTLLGASLSRYDKESYIHLWRYIGYLIGIDEDFNPCTSYVDVRKSLPSMMNHYLRPNSRSVEVVQHVLRALSNHKPFSVWSYSKHCAMARAILGEKLSRPLKIDSSKLFDTIYIRVVVVVIRLYSYFFTNWIKPKDDRIEKTLRFARKVVYFVLSLTERD